MDTQRWLADCFARGMHLATHDKNFDYAHEMFAECVVLEPGNLRFAEAMMANLRARSGGGGKGAKTRGPEFWAARAMRRAAAKKNWPEVLRAGVKLLGTNPRHVPTLRAMARACEALHYNEVELVYLKQALDANPKDIESNRHCAVSLARMGQFDQAMACWHRIEECFPVGGTPWQPSRSNTSRSC